MWVRKDLIQMALSDGRRMIAWLYHNVALKERKPIRCRITMNGIRNTSSRLTWIDGRTGALLRTDRAVQAPYEAGTPEFEGHIALMVEPVR